MQSSDQIIITTQHWLVHNTWYKTKSASWQFAAFIRIHLHWRISISTFYSRSGYLLRWRQLLHTKGVHGVHPFGRVTVHCGVFYWKVAINDLTVTSGCWNVEMLFSLPALCEVKLPFPGGLLSQGASITNFCVVVSLQKLSNNQSGIFYLNYHY